MDERTKHGYAEQTPRCGQSLTADDLSSGVIGLGGDNILMGQRLINVCDLK